jgi:uncharacterized protein
MYIRVNELELRKLEFVEDFQPGKIELGAEVRQTAPLHTSGRAELVREHHGKGAVVDDIRVVGEFSTNLEFSCARCLEPVPQSVARPFDLLYRPLGVDRGHEEVSISEAETEIGYYEGDGVHLEDVLREQVLLAVPIRLVCNESCKGLCPHCGKNLNDESCECKEELPDPRWDALKELRKNLQ